MSLNIYLVDSRDQQIKFCYSPDSSEDSSSTVSSEDSLSSPSSPSTSSPSRPSISSSSSITALGTVIVIRIESSSASANSTPSGNETSPAARLSPTFNSEMSNSREVGIFVGRAEMVMDELIV